MRYLTIALCLALLLGSMPAQPVLAADGGKERLLADSTTLSLDADTIVSRAHGQVVDMATEQAVSYLRLNAAKEALRALSRQHRRDRNAIKREVAPALRKCQLLHIDRAYEKDKAQLQAAIVAHRLELGYVNRQKGITKFTNRLGQFARFIGETIKETLKDPPPQLLATLASGGGHKIVLKALGKRFTKVFKRRLGDELLAKLTGVRSEALRAEATAACDEPEGTGTTAEDDAEAQWDVRMNTGPFWINDAYGYSLVYDRQGGATMSWEGIVDGPCSAFEAYNPRPDDPRHEKLPAIHAALRFEPDAGRFGGVVYGGTASNDLSAGGKHDGRFRALLSGTMTPVADEGWELHGERSSARLSYAATLSCGTISKTWAESANRTAAGPVKVTGRVRPGVSDWVLELDIERQDGGQAFRANLRDIPLGPVVLYDAKVEPAPAADPAAAATGSPAPSTEWTGPWDDDPEGEDG